MQQIPMGPDGKLTDEQRRRAVQYAFDLLAGATDDSEENRDLSEKMKKGFRTNPKDHE